MVGHSHISVNNLLYSCVDKVQRGNEQFVAEHSLGYIISGEISMQTENGPLRIQAGRIGMVRRNQLVKSLKVPPPSGECVAINIQIGQDFLRKYAADHKIERCHKYAGESLLLLPPDPFLKGYFDSLLPYFTQGKQPPESLAQIKTNEAVELLLNLDTVYRDFLFDFSEPHKVDLESYMNRHYTFNVPTAQFARLTGRSLAAFKRDFEKIFKTSPGQWLQQKRLAEAWYQIKEKGRKPTDVYLDVGFENLSHFSFAFKKAFGIAPSRA